MRGCALKPHFLWRVATCRKGLRMAGYNSSTGTSELTFTLTAVPDTTPRCMIQKVGFVPNVNPVGVQMAILAADGARLRQMALKYLPSQAERDWTGGTWDNLSGLSEALVNLDLAVGETVTFRALPSWDCATRPWTCNGAIYLSSVAVYCTS